MHRADSAAAKQFFLAVLEEQAIRDAVTLSDIEGKMFLFSESSGEEAARLAEEFGERCDEAEYESKITMLLRRAYRRERRLPDRSRQWKQALNAINDEDFYGMVMLEAAGLPMKAAELGLWRQVRDLLPYAGATLVFGLPAAALSLDVFQWGLIQAAWMRGLLLVACAAGLWLATEAISRRQWPRTTTGNPGGRLESRR